MFTKQCTLIKNFTAPLTGVSSVHCDQLLGFFNFSAMEEDIEIWRDIPDYEGFFQVSTFGAVKSLRRIIIRSNGRKQTFKERILKGGISNGYRHVRLHKYKKRKGFKVSVLVAMAFLGHKPDGTNKIIVDHKDNNRLNDFKSNLQLITIRENSSKDKFRGNYTSKYIGVCWANRTNKWKSQIRINGKKIFLGYFNIEEDAAEAYQNKLKEINQK